MKRLIYTTLLMITLCFTFSILSVASTKQYTGTININTADIQQLSLLPGIGPKKAQAILDLRQKKAFAKIEELLLVEGIGEALFVKIKPHIALEGAHSLTVTTSPGPTPPPKS